MTLGSKLRPDRPALPKQRSTRRSSSAMRPNRAWRRAARVALGLSLILPLFVGLTHPGRVAVKTVLLLPELFPDPPARPLLWVSWPPRYQEHSYESAVGPVDVDLYLPATDGRHGSLILYTGAFGLRREPTFVKFAEALARSGAVVMVPESAALRAGEILPGEVDGLLQALAYLRGRSEVDPARVGVIGFSAGGSLVLLAAEDVVAREQIAFLNIFGSYYDARELLLAVASHEIEVDGRRLPWEPADVTVYTLAKQLIAQLPDATDRAILGRAYLEHLPEALAELSRLSPDGCLVRELFERPSRERAAAILEALPQRSRDRLAAVSPSTGVSRLKANLYVMHDRADRYIPFTHSRDLVATAPPGTVRRYTEFDLFGHVMPNRQLDAPAFARELLRLFHHAWLVGQEFL